MSVAKVAVSIDGGLLQKLDDYVRRKVFKNRSQAFQAAITHAIDRLEHKRLIEECKKLDIYTERELADEGLVADFEEWSKF
jgi:metal-responsive CopG/Arc/MetJ family transcriptional regulator